MAATITTVDLSQLPPPDVVEPLDFETILADMLADLQARAALSGTPFTALVESDPAYKILEVAAYRELLLRQRVNEGAQAVMLAYAAGSDLDNIGANYDCARLVITPADNTTIPPTPAVMETDTDYRARIQLSMEGYTCAGPVGSYQFLAKSASADVLDVSVTTPVGGTVLVSLLSRTGNGAAPQATIDAVSAALTAETVRPLCDTVIVQSATIVSYSINATLTFPASVDTASVTANALASAQAYVAARHKVGASVTVAGVHGALMVGGVLNAVLQAPGITADILPTDTQATYCTSITLANGGIGE
jgi:phage-related baseplate assembly protein